MSDFKEIKVDNNKSISYEINNDSFIPMYIISARNTSEYPKTIQFCQWDDYSIISWYGIDYEDYDYRKNELHTFEKNHPLYLPLLHLLNGDEELIIDDDETNELNKKYVRIFNDENIINIDFINDFDNYNSMNNKFNIFIKNVEFDLRSKIDCQEKDTKERLYFFFNEVSDLFFEEYHQTSIEEYMLNNDLLTKKESKKYVKKFNRE